MSVFTDRALYWMNEFKKNPGGDKQASRPVLPGVGSHWLKGQSIGGTMFPTPAKYQQFLKTHHVTDCITYVTDVLRYAYLDVQNQKMADLVKRSDMVYDATNLAKYLVDMEGWKGYYWNPDAGLSGDRERFDEDPQLAMGYLLHYGHFGRPVPQQGLEKAAYRQAYADWLKEPPAKAKADQDAFFEKTKKYVNEHSYTANQARDSHSYYKIRVTDSITGWQPTPRAATTFKNFNGHPNDRPEPPFPATEATTLAKKRLAEFNDRVRFGFGLARGATHNYLFSSGYIYEAHWDAAPADLTDQNSDPLYQVTQLPAWSQEAGWSSGIIVVPGDSVLNMVLPAA